MASDRENEAGRDVSVLYSWAAGTGRTIVAKTVFEDLRGDDRFFDCGAWAVIGATYQVKEVLIDIISQVVDENIRGSEYKLVGEEEEKIGEYLYRMLEHRRYMIVLDDVRDVQILHRLMGSLPEQRNGSIVLVATSDLVKMGVFAGAEERRHSYPYIHEMPTAKNEQCSWVPLRMNLFGEMPISPELEEVGKKIAENCGGLRISLAKTLLYLSKTEKTMQEWSRIAADKENPIFMVGDEILEVYTLFNFTFYDTSFYLIFFFKIPCSSRIDYLIRSMCNYLKNLIMKYE